MSTLIAHLRSLDPLSPQPPFVGHAEACAQISSPGPTIVAGAPAATVPAAGRPSAHFSAHRASRFPDRRAYVRSLLRRDPEEPGRCCTVLSRDGGNCPANRSRQSGNHWRYSPETVHERLRIGDMMEQLRDSGVHTRGPAALSHAGRHLRMHWISYCPALDPLVVLIHPACRNSFYLITYRSVGMLSTPTYRRIIPWQHFILPIPKTHRASWRSSMRPSPNHSGACPRGCSSSVSAPNSCRFRCRPLAISASTRGFPPIFWRCCATSCQKTEIANSALASINLSC